MKVTYDSQGRDITCMKEFSALKFPCRECDVKDCDEREEDKWMNKMSKKRAQEIIMATACCSFGTRLLCNNCPWREKRDCDIVIDEELFTEALDTLRNERTVNEMKLSDIKIRECFKATTPSERKMEKCREYWKLTHNQDRYIIVDHNNVLVDGYVMYLVLKENGVEEVEVKVTNRFLPNYRRKMTTYIYGFHPNSKEPKEFVWRVPKSWKGWENDLLPGDRIIVSTKNGFAQIIITKIEWLDKPPVDTPIKRVVTKCFDHDTTNAKINSLLDKIMNAVYRMESNCEEKQGVEDYRIFDDIAEIEDAIENIQRMIW